MRQPIFARLIRSVAVYEETKRQVSDLIVNHRFISGKWVGHRVRLSVIGPRCSGKSVLLGELVNQLAVEFVFTGEWKSNFVFGFDVLQVIPHIDDYEKLVEIIVNQVLEAIAEQKPLLLESLQQMKRKLLAAVTIGAGDLPTWNRTPFDAIAKRISELWRQDGSHSQFLSAVFQLPVLVARAAGIENVVLVIDNIDQADLYLAPRDPFGEESSFVFLIELLKYVLDGVNFVIACQDATRFFEVMRATGEDGIDLLDGMEFASTMDVQESRQEESERDRFAVHVEGDDLPLQLHIGLCGGVIHFLNKWKGLCNLVSQMDSCPRGPEFDDAQFAAIHAAQEFVSLVFNPGEDEPEIHVTNIVRLSDLTEF
jgi:hypothetical protein